MRKRHTPTPSQRIVIIVGLVAVAWLLHVTLCEWAFRSSYSGLPLLTFRSGTGAGMVHTGLMVQVGVDIAMAALFGLAAPAILVAASVYQFLEWRHLSSTARGLCPRCGYDLRAATADCVKCPECGWPDASDGA